MPVSSNIDLSGVSRWPFHPAPLTISTTTTKVLLPASHGPLKLSVQGFTNAVYVSFNPAGTDAGALAADFWTIPANGAATFDIPPTSLGGVVAVYIAAAANPTTVQVELTRLKAE